MGKIVFLGAGGFLVWYLLGRKQETKSAPVQTSTTSQAATVAARTAVDDARAAGVTDSRVISQAASQAAASAAAAAAAARAASTRGF